MAGDSFTKLPSPYYRVTARAIIFDERMRLLVIENAEGNYELPGGGWEHDESFEECIRREVREELGVEVLWIGGIWFTYRGKRRNRPWFLRLCAPVLLKSHDFEMGEGMTNAYFVTREVFMNTTFAADETPIKEHVEKLWKRAALPHKSPVEKKHKKR